MKFIALDLETTGLDPNTDTIIEVAAISFSLEKDEDGKFQMMYSDERTMLVDPERELKEEVTMITGITKEMLQGRKRWSEIQERIGDFIGNAVIVGHNVLFDIKMLETHGINLTKHTILDTFELSELFSQEAESLNLGFLSGIYGLQAGEAEHRALGDTRLSIALFLKYLNEVQDMSEMKKSILRLMAKKEKSRSITLLNEIASIVEGDIFEPHFETTYQTKGDYDRRNAETKKEYSLSLGANIEAEISLIKKTVLEQGHTSLLVSNKKIQAFMNKVLNENNCHTMMGVDYSRFCSLEEVQSMVENQEGWDRKTSIFMGKILFWLETTKTGLLEELRFYGEEREYIRFFRTREDEYNIFRTSYSEEVKNASCVIYETGEFLKSPIQELLPSILIKDIPLLEDSVRKGRSTHIHIESIVKDLKTFPDTKNLISTLYIIGDMYENIPKRPIGENMFPPGDFGETYFFHQEELWSKKGKWLVLFTNLLIRYHDEWRSIRKTGGRRGAIRISSIDAIIEKLISYHLYRDENLGVIIHIKEEETVIRMIPRNVSGIIQEVFIKLPSKNIVTYGYNLCGPIMSRFLKSECGVQYMPVEYMGNIDSGGVLRVISADTEIQPGTIILTTSQRHIREIGRGAKDRGINIFMQGISGGKGKILALFEKNPEDSILIGLIDTWRDEVDLWKLAKDIIIAKLPFDPPSDPYFLARTVGMSDNFANYSEPMVIIRVNTLIGRIRNAGYKGNISCLDDRLEKTLWGKEIAGEIL